MMDRIELSEAWAEIRQHAARIEIDVEGPGAVLVHVNDSDRAPASNAPAFRLPRGTTRVFDQAFTYCRIWARAEDRSATITFVRTTFRG